MTKVIRIQGFKGSSEVLNTVDLEGFTPKTLEIILK